MGKSGLACLVIVSVVAANLAHATYIIKLRNGNEYLTNRYWHEGSQILFDAEGGIFGVDKVLVQNIEKTDKVIKLITAVNLDASDKPQLEVKDESQNVKDSPAADPKTPAAKDESDPIYKEFGLLKDQSGKLAIMSRSELEDYVNKVAKLISTIQKERKTNHYLQEYSELNALANSIEEMIKSRR